MNLFEQTYRDKKILITGNTGFKGSWLTAWLINTGAKVYGLSDNIPTVPSHFKAAKLENKIQHYYGDIRNLENVKAIIHEIQPDFLFHLAAQALVSLSYKSPAMTLETNVLGTINILEALRLGDFSCNAIMITSDKCYDNVEWTWGYRETDRIGGKDPYSASKGAAELAIKTYAASYFSKKDSPVKVTVARAGNVIGGGDWALDRIVPDCVKAWARHETVEVRNPNATRPWQHVLEPLSGYLVLGSNLAENPKLNGEPFNFGPSANQNRTVKELIEEMRRHWRQVQWLDISSAEKHFHEAGLLKLCCDKALHSLHWEPTLNFEETVKMTANWYRSFYENECSDIFNCTRKQIEDYEKIAKSRNLSWTI